MALYNEEAGGDAVFAKAKLAPEWMETKMAEEKIEIEQAEAFTEELSDEALERGTARACTCCNGW